MPVIFALGHDDEPIPADIWDAPIAGATISASWAATEPRARQYDWTVIDADVIHAAEARKKVMIGVIPGINTPAWVYNLGARSVSLSWWIAAWGPLMGSVVRVPVPWDAVYLREWSAFVAALGARYAGHPAVAGIKMAGINAQTIEQVLPWHKAYFGPGAIDPLIAWRDAGYRPALLTGAWSQCLAAYPRAFPHMRLILQTGGWGMPPLDSTGASSAVGSRGDVALTESFMHQSYAALGARLALANDGINAHWHWLAPIPGVPVGAQTSGPMTPNCERVWGAIPCDPVTTLRGVLTQAAGNAYLELYIPDILNPHFAGMFE